MGAAEPSGNNTRSREAREAPEAGPASALARGLSGLGGGDASGAGRAERARGFPEALGVSVPLAPAALAQGAVLSSRDLLASLTTRVRL